MPAIVSKELFEKANANFPVKHTAKREIKTKTGVPYIANDVEDKFRNALKHYNAYETEQAKLENREPALIENCCPHSLRHSFCSLLCENDVNIKTIQEIMGHKNVATTINIYSEVSDTKKRNELRQLEEKFISIN